MLTTKQCMSDKSHNNLSFITHVNKCHHLPTAITNCSRKPRRISVLKSHTVHTASLANAYIWYNPFWLWHLKLSYPLAFLEQIAREQE